MPQQPDIARHVFGVIAEYDPFHTGHAAHLAATRAAGATHIVVVLDGSFTQRGGPAMLPTDVRAAMALSCGADLVIGLPLTFAMASAERFAAGGVFLLHALGCVETLSFGAECGDAGRLSQIADALDTPQADAAMHRALDDGLSYAAARAAAAAAVCSELHTMPFGPNDTLGVEYIRAARRIGAPFSFLAVRRQGAAHDGDAPAEGFASAGLLRRLIRSGRIDEAAAFLPPESERLLRAAIARGDAPGDPARLDTALLAHLRMMEPEQLAALPGISEGLEHRLYAAVRTAPTAEALLQALATRRYPAARLRRLLWSAMLGLPADRLSAPPYIRLLGMTARGQALLSAAHPTLPLLTRTAQVRSLSPAAQAAFAAECRAADLHALTLPVPRPCGTLQRSKMLRF